MANQTNASFAAMLKTLWFTGEIQNLALKNNPFLGMVPKKTDFYGDGLKIPLSYADLQGRSATFANAQAQSTPSKYAAFTITRAPTDYAIGRVDGETLETSQSNKGAFMAALEAEIKRGRNSITRSLAVKLFRATTGVLGQNTSGTASPVTVSTADSYNFEVGMTIGAVSDNTGSGTVRTGTGFITAINRQASATTATITYTGTITGLTATDYFFVSGDYNAAISGLAAWVPDSAPSATSFFGVDRTADVTRLGGMRFTSSAPIEEAFQDALAELYLAGSSPTHAFMNPLDFKNLINALGAKVVRTKVMGTAGTGYSAVEVDSPAGTIKVLADPNCPKLHVYILQMDTWCLYSCKEAPHILEYGGGEILRMGDQDAVEFRMGYRAQLGCSAPGYNAVLILS